jgi:hypothetical protein
MALPLKTLSTLGLQVYFIILKLIFDSNFIFQKEEFMSLDSPTLLFLKVIN